MLDGSAHVSLQIDDFKSSVDDTMSFFYASLELTPTSSMVKIFSTEWLYQFEHVTCNPQTYVSQMNSSESLDSHITNYIVPNQTF